MSEKIGFSIVQSGMWRKIRKLHRYGRVRSAKSVTLQLNVCEALKWAIKALKDGKVIGIYPEGTRSLTGKLQKAKTGVARLALAAKVPVVPVGLIGMFEILPKGCYIPKFKRATINIGNPIYFKKYYNKKINNKILNEITTKIMNEIAKLSNQKYNF